MDLLHMRVLRYSPMSIAATQDFIQAHQGSYTLCLVIEISFLPGLNVKEAIVISRLCQYMSTEASHVPTPQTLNAM